MDRKRARMHGFGQTDRQTHILKDLETEWSTGRGTNRQTDRQTDRL